MTIRVNGHIFRKEHYKRPDTVQHDGVFYLGHGRFESGFCLQDTETGQTWHVRIFGKSTETHVQTLALINGRLAYSNRWKLGYVPELWREYMESEQRAMIFTHYLMERSLLS